MIYYWDGGEFAKRIGDMAKLEEFLKAEKPWDKGTSVKTESRRIRKLE